MGNLRLPVCPFAEEGSHPVLILSNPGRAEDADFAELNGLFCRSVRPHFQPKSVRRGVVSIGFEFLLYDVRSTFFEGQAEKNEKAARGYSRDSRPDCQQVCIGGSPARRPPLFPSAASLVCTPEGLPLSYEVFAGNRTDVTTEAAEGTSIV